MQTAQDTQVHPTVRPRGDVYKSDTEHLVVLDVPGTTPEGLSVRLEKGLLQIEATPAWEAPEGAVTREFRAVRYARSFQLGDEVDVDAIRAELRDGVLRIHLPHAASKRARQIDVIHA